MSKELTPLEALEKVRNCTYPFASDNQKAFDVIETALKNYEDLQKVLDDFGIHNIQNLIDTLKNISFLETELLGQSQELNVKNKALEIIKKHKLLNYVLKNQKCANMYHLSKEEIDSLKEILL